MSLDLLGVFSGGHLWPNCTRQFYGIFKIRNEKKSKKTIAEEHYAKRKLLEYKELIYIPTP